jgi:hypothetical protein
LNSATYFTIPLYKPKVAKDCMEYRKFLKLPISAKPSAPIKCAMALEVNKPPVILVISETEFNEATLNNTLLFIYLINLFN